MRNVNLLSILPASLKNMCFASSLLAFVPHAYATDDVTLAEDTQWYEVNIAIFKQNTPGFQSEQWRNRDQLNLQFPHRTVMLDDESYDNINVDEIELEPYIPNDSLLGVELTLNNAAPISTPPLPTPVVSQNTSTFTEQPLTAEEEAFFDNKELLPKITAFRLIDTEDEGFRQTLRRLRNSKGYKILTTKTWRQPGLARNISIPVLIQAGDAFDGNYELEGTVNISLSRYLHVQSNLWLSEYVKQIELSNTWWEESTRENAPTFEGLLTDSTYALETGEPEEQNLNDTTAIDSDDSNTTTPLLSALNINGSTAHYEAIRTVVIDESRRMRSNEIHYLDHPLFGMVIKVTPYEAPIPEIEKENLAQIDAQVSTELPANKEAQAATQKTQPAQQKVPTQ
jgi:hypothetical protein